MTTKKRRGGGESMGNQISEEEIDALDLGRIEYFAIPSQTRLQDPNRPPRFVAIREPPIDRKDFAHVLSEYARIARFSVERHTFFEELRRWELVLVLTQAGFLKVAYAEKAKPQSNAERIRSWTES